MFYLVSGRFAPNTAPSNRVMAYVRAFSELAIETNVVFFAPDSAHSKVGKVYPHIKFHYLWDKGYVDLPRLRQLSMRFYLWSFVKGLLPGDIVYVYGFPDLVVSLSTRNDIKVFAERTEYDKVSFNCYAKKVTVQDYLEAARRICGVIVISQPLKHYYIQEGCSPERVHIVNMIADRNRFIGVKKQQTEPYIAYCGTASNTKDGVDELIKAFALTAQRHPDYKLYIIGSTPSKKQRFYNLELVKELGLEHSVVFTGEVSAQDIPQMLTNATVLALDRPDNLQAKYGFPTKLGEYLLTGNPVVVTRVGDIPLFLEDGKNALIAEPQNSQNFSAKLCWAIEHPDDAKIIGECGREVAKTYFNYVTETEKILAILDN